MTRPTVALPLAFTFAAFITFTQTGCLGIAGALLEGLNQGSSDSSASAATSGDCHDAVKTCEDFVAAFCARADECGVLTFDDCTNQVITEKMPCERAESADDFTQCDDDLGTESCDDFANQAIPQSCKAPLVHFSDTVCR